MFYRCVHNLKTKKNSFLCFTMLVAFIILQQLRSPIFPVDHSACAVVDRYSISRRLCLSVSLADHGCTVAQADVVFITVLIGNKYFWTKENTKFDDVDVSKWVQLKYNF